ncbi:unnamed protein product [Plutella xylostella]|uniref:(diamondback moth) hypothetical protein n=1 Tax=Plutella xylostella TaxID=51655 RepID=A0A8S4G6M0_PLUXY|nr:unnamed protein product [Plutella xylostella]
MTQLGLVGLALSYALSLTSMVSGVMNAFTETEREMIAVERVGEYIREIQVEKIDGDPPPYGWPTQGVIEFKDVVLKYSDRPSAAAALNGVSFSTHSGERVGVVGRTGAGKSSLLHALLRTRRLQAGAVTVDNVPLSTMHLHALRSRIGVIPQEPFIFTGTVRENTDPLRIHTDAEISRALERCGAAGEAFALACPAAALSRGQRQLLCLARALLQRAKFHDRDVEISGALERCGAAGEAFALACPAAALSRGQRQLLCLARALLQRAKLDCIHSYRDVEISRALERCGAAGERFALACPAAALSRGQRQLLCLARALLQRAKRAKVCCLYNYLPYIHTDAEISRALERCGAAGEAFALACPAAALSRGQRQLLCLARALLQRAKVLLIDEATANLDQETERLILDALKCSFAGATVLFVAHRVLGVLECARVLVLAQGKVQEYAPPDELLADPTSQLYRLVHAHEE